MIIYIPKEETILDKLVYKLNLYLVNSKDVKFIKYKKCTYDTEFGGDTYYKIIAVMNNRKVFKNITIAEPFFDHDGTIWKCIIYYEKIFDALRNTIDDLPKGFINKNVKYVIEFIPSKEFLLECGLEDYV